MRPSAAAVLALVAALVGGVVSVVAADRTGLIGGRSETVFISGSGAALPVEREIEAPSTARPLLGNGFDPAEIFSRRSRGVVTVYAYFDGRPPAQHAAQGSGFLVSREGYVLTSAHVVTTAGEGEGIPDAADRVFVAFRDGDRIPATVVGWDVYDDVGVLKVDSAAHAIEPVPLGDSAGVVVGEPVAALGSPFGNENSLAVGVVSATRRSIDSLTSEYTVANAIQTDAPITHGNSGGPLFDARGRVIGINAQIRSESGQAEGVGFAIPINAAKRSFAQLVRNGRVAYAYVGINAEDLTPTIARRFGYRVERGAVIASVVPDSPGARAGLRGGNENRRLNGVEFRYGGDVVVRIGQQAVGSADDLVRVVSERLAPGQVVHFTVFRKGERLVMPVRLGERPRRPKLDR
ncbi:MAG: trypsin-like peptidase domain-containing protein [Actinobacteria bacterium]|nr:trypsin-like peptidase domain-containing protein [Actinomycetota bacterium]